MSRIPQSSARSPVKAPTSAPSRPRSRATTPVRTRTKSATSRSAPKPAVKDDDPPAVPATPMSIKEAIALKRAEAKKLQARNDGGGSALDNFSSLEDALPVAAPALPEEDVLGRWPVRETIERGRSTGTINLSSRALPCIPSALFEIHLGITADPLKSVPNEPVLPPSDPSTSSRRGGKRDNPAWFEAQDLQTLKAWNNEIVEIQHEISLFGSLKVVDLHANQISSLPQSFGDLTALTTLDLSYNALTSLPANIFTFPQLTSLNISHNQLTTLPFNAPFASGRKHDGSRGGSFFVPVITRSSTPLPRLISLVASHNKITASGIDLELPASLFKVDLSSNPLGESMALIRKLGSLPNLKELRLEHADINNTSFPADLTSSASFPRLRILDLGETKVTPEAAQAAMKGLKQELSFDLTTEDPPEGVARIIVGKKIIREAWEIEAERKAKARAAKMIEEDGLHWGAGSQNSRSSRSSAPQEVVKEAWELEAEQGLLTEGGKRRARAQAAAAAADTSSRENSSPSKPMQASEPVKEAWEIEAEQGLLTEGGKRRARAAAAAAAAAEEKKSTSASQSPAVSLTNPQYYSQATNTLTLPASAPPSKNIGHGRAVSMAVNLSSFGTSSRTSDLAVPIPTAPLAEIAAQPFSLTLRVLILCNRRADRTITLPHTLGSALLPNLEELDLEGCNFADSVSVSRSSISSDSGSGSPNRSTEPLLPLLTSLFPNLRSLNLSYNTLSSTCLTTEVLSALILAAPHRKGLKQLVLRGNRITDLNGLQGVAELFKGNRDVPGWKLDELDLRDNDIGKLPAELGLLPLDVFLVDGNAFRAPPRRIWEREGTKGLLSWLRGRIE